MKLLLTCGEIFILVMVKNIKIVDGKLIWTSTGVNIGYDISGDTKQDLLGTDSSLGIMHQIRNKYDYEGGMEDLKKIKEDVKSNTKKVIRTLSENKSRNNW